MRKPFIAANWKMNLTQEKAERFVDVFCGKFSVFPNKQVEVAICPPFVYLMSVAHRVKKQNAECGLDIKVGAQNMHWEKEGAFTGEISANMLVESGCAYVILGHSERREKFGETDEKISKKAAAAFSNGLLPIICVGETLAQREENKTLEVVKKQLDGSLSGLTSAQVGACTLAYEPVWAIGTGRTARPEMAQEVHKMIRDYLSDHYGNFVSDTVCIQYGGSVKAENIQELIVQPDIDGALVGGASLDPDSFAELARRISETKK